MYRTRLCAYCLLAKRLLDKKGVGVREVDLSSDHEARSRLSAVTEQRSVPQIYIDGRFVGGYRELVALEKSGELDLLLSGACKA